MGSQMPWSRIEINSQMQSQSLSEPSQSPESCKGLILVPESSAKASWDRSATEAFIRICVEEVHAGNRPGSHFNRTGWENIRKKFKVLTSRDYTRVQLKNRWDALKKDWSLWINLIRNSTGLGWDIGRGTVQASTEWWAQKLKQIPEAAKFKLQGPLLINEQQILFADVVATGESAWTPSSGLLPAHLFDEPNVNVEGQEAEINDVDPEFGLGQETNLEFEPDPINESEDVQHTDARSGTRNRRNTRNDKSIPVRMNHKKQKKMTSADKIAKSIDRMVDKFTCGSVSCSGSNTVEGVGSYTIKECIDILYTMSGVEENGRLWMLATRLFLKPGVRELFLALRTNEARLKWLEEQYVRDMQRSGSWTPSGYASRGESHHNDDASSR